MQPTLRLQRPTTWILTAVASLATGLLPEHASGAKQHHDHLAAGHVVERESLTLAGARLVLDAAAAHAKQLGSSGSIAVVDRGGQLVALERLDGSFAASPMIAYGKARTAALFEKPTKVFEDVVNNGRTTMVTLEGFTPLQGGLPIVIDGSVVGAVGVSGAASAQQDEEVALAGAAALVQQQ